MMPFEVVAFAVLWLAVVCITKIISENRTRRKLIEARPSEEMVRALFQRREDPAAYAALKWGLVVVGLGIALVAIEFLPWDFSDPIIYGLMFLFGGCGLLSYYAIVSWKAKRRGSG